MSAEKQCSIFFYNGWLSASPSIINLAKVLAKNGYTITIYTIASDYPKIEKFSNGIFVNYINPLIPKFLSQLMYKNNLGVLAKITEFANFTFQIFTHQLKQSVMQFKSNEKSSESSNVSIGVDSVGGILAFIESLFTNGRLVYFSLELQNKNNANFALCGRRLESLIYKKMDCILIQDEERFQTLSEYHEYWHKRVFYIPNSVSLNSLVHHRNQNKTHHPETSSNYFSEIFNLNPQKNNCFVVQAGMICDEVLSNTLASTFKAVNKVVQQKNIFLVFHECRKRELEDPYIVSLKHINSDNLLLSLDPLPFEQISEVFRAIHIGLAFYKDIDANYSQIAKASGKLSGYLEAGKPVLMSNLSSLSELNNKYSFGITIDDPSDALEIERAISTILNNYEFYSQNALNCFREEFDFYSKINNFIDFI